MATIRSYPSPARALKADDALLGDADGTVQIPFGLISEAVIASLSAALPSLISSAIEDFFAGLPDEAKGDVIPSSGPYLSAGVLKLA